MLLLTKKDRETGKIADVLINSKSITSAVFVPSCGMTAINMDSGPSIWVEDTPEDIYNDLQGDDRG